MNEGPQHRTSGLSRRKFLTGAVGVGAIAGSAGLATLVSRGLAGGSTASTPGTDQAPTPQDGSEGPLTHPGVVGEVDTTRFDPMDFLTDFDYGRVSTLPNGQTLREYEIAAVDQEIEVAPGIYFPAWTYNGTVPGPTLRCTEGDRIRIRFVNGGSHPHTIHFHGIHPANMDGVIEQVPIGGSYVYEFDAEPFGLHLYHCHSSPLKQHIHKGLYGVFIVDPPGGRPPAKEFVMVMNGFDTNFDGENEVYAVNTVAHYYLRHPIQFKVDELVRLYVVNITEFDPINSLHIHANFFHVYRTGTKLEPDDFTDTIMMCQAERHVLEFRYKTPGLFMFHAHQSEFAELGWLGFFDVLD